MIAPLLLAAALAAAPRPEGPASPADARRGAEAPAAPGCGLPPLADGPRPWRTGERLAYSLDVLGMVQAGTLELSVERPMSGGGIVPLRARAKTTSAVANVKPFAGVGLSWIDARTLLPERYRDEADEGGTHKMSDARIPQGGGEVVLEYRYGERSGRDAFAREGEVLDPLSTLAYLRAARLEPGDRFCFDLVGNRRFWRVEASVAAKAEKVDTPAGSFDTLRVDATARRADRPDAPGRPVHLWFSRDARRLPVAMVSEVDLGPVSATLESVRGTRQERAEDGAR